MDSIIVNGGRRLNGTVSTSGSKNAALPILFASLLADGRHHFDNVPELRDIESTQQLLASLGASSERHGSALVVDVKPPQAHVADYDMVRKMRAGILCLGPLLARYGEARVSLPGGCAIGSRPIDLHIETMRRLGADITSEGGYVVARAQRLVGDRILFEKVTVGGTENALMAASLARGTTVIENAAKEPEVVDLANYLIAMGAKIEGVGSSVITVEGVDELTPASHSIVPDRIEAGTLLIAGAITGGHVTVDKCIPEHLQSLVDKMRDAGFRVDTAEDSITLHSTDSWRAVDIATAPYPGFPTDLQAQFMALMTQAEGTAVITEHIFENRFMHVQELVRLGADITPMTQVAVVRGEHKGLSAAPVMATDLRASACLVLAGLVAEGETEISRIYHLDRGYEHLENKLAGLGADVRRVAADA
ncbi:UDP-N-acetylglucosamine 1-carboxyvinyltransferase [Pseudohalioglobus sediminis]|uniref:UDP-N-acetylglucosamine 1-carboxyvinyltransferase n=1 Tax=Pseudohalioglobus sediminis TaxID=2606449 RepID=A0A5B0WQ68_9GAMM|nr:UDP-N-acetylglucosamine 1-carboxyvinyltransferase [Pseudohalioglobus sediminis]KAA1189244.1 UDP-N-acetylglucosamine 1-carboxyvinyltransferase [Pseudohalioglobus sediminis]